MLTLAPGRVPPSALTPQDGVSSWLQEACGEVKAVGKTPDPCVMPCLLLIHPSLCEDQELGAPEITEPRRLALCRGPSQVTSRPQDAVGVAQARVCVRGTTGISVGPGVRATGLAVCFCMGSRSRTWGHTKLPFLLIAQSSHTSALIIVEMAPQGLPGQELTPLHSRQLASAGSHILGGHPTPPPGQASPRRAPPL